MSRLFFVPVEDPLPCWLQQATVSEPLSEALEVAMQNAWRSLPSVPKPLETGQVRVLHDVRQIARDHAPLRGANQENA